MYFLLIIIGINIMFSQSALYCTNINVFGVVFVKIKRTIED